MPGRLLAALLLTASLAACARDAAQERQAMLDEVIANYRANLAGVRAPAGGDTPPNDTPPGAAAPGDAAPDAATGAAPALLPALAGVPPRAAQLLGQPPAAVVRLLGSPSLRRREGDAEIWLYQSPFCHLDVMLYGDTASPALRVTYATARAAGAERRTEAACLQDLARGRA